MEITGLSENNIRKISKTKDEDQWVLDFRLKSYELFNKLDMPDFGPKFDLDFEKVIYYKSQEKGMNNNWNKIDNNIKCEFQSLGVIDSENTTVQDSIGLLFKQETGLNYTNETEPIIEDFTLPPDNEELTTNILDQLEV